MTQHISSTLVIPEVNAIPRHVAIIMDGNGRWASKRFMPRVTGHSEGLAAVRKIVQECRSLGVEYLTIFAFSSERSDFCNFGYSPKYESDDSDWPKNQKIYSEHERIRLTKNNFGRLNIHENTKIQKSVFQYKGRRSRVSQVKSRVEISTFFPTNRFTCLSHFKIWEFRPKWQHGFYRHSRALWKAGNSHFEGRGAKVQTT